MRQQSRPPENVVEILEAHDQLELFVRALNDTELREVLEGHEGPLTIFAPLDSAFERLSDERLDRLFRNEHRPVLRRIARRHVVPRNLRASSLKNGLVETLGGAMVETESADRRLAFDGGELTRTDIVASNGLIHTVDRLSVPENLDDLFL